MMCVDTLDVFARSDECPECSLQRTGLLLIGITYRFFNQTFRLRVSTLVHKQHLNDLILLCQKIYSYTKTSFRCTYGALLPRVSS